jgi:hypothetical protein
MPSMQVRPNFQLRKEKNWFLLHLQPLKIERLDDLDSNKQKSPLFRAQFLPIGSQPMASLVRRVQGTTHGNTLEQLPMHNLFVKEWINAQLHSLRPTSTRHVLISFWILVQNDTYTSRTHSLQNGNELL